MIKKISSKLKSIKKEISEITWVKPRELIKNVLVSLAFCCIVGIFFYFIDIITTLVLTNILKI